MAGEASISNWSEQQLIGLPVVEGEHGKYGLAVLSGGCRLAVLCYKPNVLTGQASISNWSEQQFIGLPVVDGEHGK